MATIYAPHRVTTTSAYYADVRTEMARRGAPAVRAVWHAGYGAWLAIEGSHRLAVARELGLVPTVIDVGVSSDEITHDLQDYPSPCTLATLAEWIVDLDRLNASASYRYDDADLPRGCDASAIETLTDAE